MIWKKFNDQFAIILVFIFLAVWVADVVLRIFGKPGFDAGVMGATIALVTLITQFYFRRKEPDDQEGGKK